MGKSKPRPVYFFSFSKKDKSKHNGSGQRDGRHRRPLDELIAEAGGDSFGQKTGQGHT